MCVFATIGQSLAIKTTAAAATPDMIGRAVLVCSYLYGHRLSKQFAKPPFRFRSRSPVHELYLLYTLRAKAPKQNNKNTLNLFVICLLSLGRDLYMCASTYVYNK